MRKFIPGDFFVGIPLLTWPLNPRRPSSHLPFTHVWGPDRSMMPGPAMRLAYRAREVLVPTVNSCGDVIAQFGATEVEGWQS